MKRGTKRWRDTTADVDAKKRYKQIAALGRALTNMAGNKENVEPMLTRLFSSSTGRSLAPNLSSIIRDCKQLDDTVKILQNNVAMMFGAMSSHSHFRKPLIALLTRTMPGFLPLLQLFLSSSCLNIVLNFAASEAARLAGCSLRTVYTARREHPQFAGLQLFFFVFFFCI